MAIGRNCQIFLWLAVIAGVIAFHLTVYKSKPSPNMSEAEFRQYVVNRQISRASYLMGPAHTFQDDGTYVRMGGTFPLRGRYRFANGEACVTLGPPYGSACYQFRVVDRLVTMRSSEDRDADPRFHLIRIR